MTLTVLLDLDDTLLTNDMNIFLPAYLKVLSGFVDTVPSKAFIKELLYATQKMTENTNPYKTLEQVFDEHFYPQLAVNKDALRLKIEEFYATAFHQLKAVTQPRPQSIQLVEEIFKKGHQVVIATNPLFPTTAIHQRLEWAGLSPAQYQFALITSFEQFHFAKPNPEYFLEILAQLGWPDQPAVMIGNSLTDDILPASKAGLPVFWLNNYIDQFPDSLQPHSSYGEIENIIDWINQIDEEQPQINLNEPETLLALLRSTPAALSSLCQDLSEQAFKFHFQQDEWSITEILCHLRDVDAEINLSRISEICNHENPFLPSVNSDPWAVERQYQNQDAKLALKQFIQIRMELIELLITLLPKGWICPARHAIFGPTTVKELVSFIATHDRNHIQQILEIKKILSAVTI